MKCYFENKTYSLKKSGDKFDFDESFCIYAAAEVVHTAILPPMVYIGFDILSLLSIKKTSSR